MSRRTPSGKKFPSKITSRSLENAALFYLRRYSTSVENLRRVLMRRVNRSARAYGTNRDEGLCIIEQILSRFCEAKLLDDLAYASARATSMRQRGASEKRIRHDLMAKGVATDKISHVLKEQIEVCPVAELKAAFIYCRRRRLGPWRSKKREEQRTKDIASLARQGYPVSIALHIIDAISIEELEKEIGFTSTSSQ